MNKLYKQIISLILISVLMLNILPAHAISLGQTDDAIATPEMQEEATLSADPAYQGLETAQITEEDTSKRSEYSKEFVMNNGLRMAAVYAEPVHYKENGQWEEIDNTLKASGDTFTNTAGVWTVAFPQEMSKGDAVTITQDGYTLSFFMSGQLLGSGNLVARATESLSIQSAQTVNAQKQEIDRSAIKANMEHPEILPDKLQSRLAYNEVFSDTDIVYDLSANQVKESIVMSAYNAKLQGYHYTLQTGQLRPVLTDSGEIHLYDAKGKSIIMTMPAPFLVDDADVCCYDVEVSLTGADGTYTLTYLLPQQWLASADRQWPVVLDPAVNANTDCSNIRDVSVYEHNPPETYLSGILDVGWMSEYGTMRTFLKYKNLPALTSADMIVEAELALYKPQNSGSPVAVEIHKVTNTWGSENTTWANQPGFEGTVEDFALVCNAGVYRWNIVDMVRGWYASGNTGLAMTIPASKENGPAEHRKQFYSSDYSSTYRPVLTIVYRNNNGLESYWDYTASSAGRAGTGYINNYTGNLVWVHSDMGYGGNLMPVSISHIYNANDIPRLDENGVLGNYYDCGMGYGWRTNYNQTINSCSLPQIVNGVTTNVTYYVWTDSDGTKHYFYKTGENTYQDEDGLDLTLTYKNDGISCTITDKYGNTSYFDRSGRLSKLENNQKAKSSISITYASNTRISTITDGAGRKYGFTYSGGFLSRLSYYGTGDTELGYLAYAYSNGCLASITYQDSTEEEPKIVYYTYNADKLLTSAKDIDGYQLTYTYHPVSGNWQPYRIRTVSETDGAANGGMLTITYGHNQTTFTDNNGNTQIAQFNNWGNTVSIQDGEGRAQFAQYATEQAANGKGNQLILTSKLQNTVGNLLKDSSFENGTLWYSVYDATRTITTTQTYFGEKALQVTSANTASYSGVGSSSYSIPSGKSCTFSAYIKTGSTAQAYLVIGDGTKSVKSETLPGGSDWTRLEVTYTNTTDAAVSVYLRIFSATAGTLYADCVQLELAESASRYNLIENGDFRHGTYGWTKSAQCDSNETTVTATSAAPELNSTVFRIVGDPQNQLRIQQELAISGAKDDTFVLAGWAKGHGVPLTEYTSDKRTFTLRGIFLYTDGTTGEFNFNFNPSISNWQYASGVMVAKKAFSGIKIQVLYDYGANTIVFDGIQLYKEEYGESYGYDSDGNVTSVKDIQGQITKYEYANNNTDLVKILQNNKAKVTYEYDSYHNVKKATTEEGLVYTFTYDNWGNNTSVSIANGETKITSSADYTSDGNRLKSTTDALGKVTTYSYNANTNLLEWVKAPGDSEATRTEYTYDEMYRLASASATTNLGYNLLVNYTYDEDLLTEIATQSTTYTFAYGNFALRSSIHIGSRELATYTYTEDRNNRLSKLEYGNQNVVQYTYDTYGRLLSQTYEDNDTVTYKYDNSGALATVQDSASGLTTRYYYDFTDRMMKYTESGTDFSHSVGYTYDKLNNLTGLQETINGAASTITYTYDDDNRVKTVTNGDVTETYSYDVYGRLIRQTTKQGDTTVTYLNYAYKTNSDGTPTDRVGRIAIYSNGYNVAYNYYYDDNGNITHISDGTNQITYVYDTQNQLLRENNPYVGRSYRYYYDNAGNITQRREYAYTTGTLTELLDTVNYTYGDADWGDLLTAYDGQAITYDGIGNPLSDGFWMYTWEHGRELGSMAQSSVLIITSQPDDCFTAVGSPCTFAVAATGTGELTYQWQYSSNGTTWRNSGNVAAVTANMSISAINETQVGLYWRCIVKDSAGHSAISQMARCVDSTVTTPITITNQPDNLYCSVGEPISFTVTATGTDLTYQWQYSSNGATWRDSGNVTAVTPTFAISAINETQVNLLYRCKITDADGNVVYSRHVSPKRETTLWEYTYNADGLRTQRTNGDTTYRYVYNGSQLSQLTVDGHTLRFTYDALGTPLTVKFNNTTYYYAINLQGDVIAIVDANGTAVVEYSYDAWGNPASISGSLAATLGYYNPLRYRGYVYDPETGLYYVSSRYYDPEIGRWMNADGQISGIGGDILGYNTFAYCMNNPVNMSDPCGNWPRWITAAVTVVAAVVTVAAAATGNFAVAAVAAKVTMAAGATYIAQSAHYDRRETKNEAATLPQSPQEAKDSDWRGPDTTPQGPAADCHQYTAKDGPNIKYVSPDGHREVIYNSAGDIVLDSRDIGTYNFCPSNELWYSNQSIGHLFHDIFPWIIFGNSDDDPGWVANKIISLFE